MVLLQKIRTASRVARNCVNWPAVFLARIGLNAKLREVRVRRGPTIVTDLPLKQIWGEVFEPAVADIYGIRDATADIIVDVGTNIGAFSCLAAWTHPDAQIYAFEPNPAVTKQAKINFRHNNLKNIHLTESVVTGDGRKVSLQMNPNRGAVNIFFGSQQESVSLLSVTLDSIPYGQAKSVFFKLDCEGAEGEIIEWIIANLDKLPARISMGCEYHPWCPYPLAKTLEALRANGFQAELREELGAGYLFASRN